MCGRCVVAEAAVHAHASTPMRRPAPAFHSTPLPLPYCGSRIGLVFAFRALSVRDMQHNATTNHAYCAVMRLRVRGGDLENKHV